MSIICIKRDVLGEPLDLCVIDGILKRSDGAPAGSWVLGDQGAEFDISLLAQLSNMSIRTVPDRFKRAFHTLNHEKPIRWQHALPKAEFQNFLHGMLDDIKILLNEGCVAYYTEVFRRTRECLGALGHARIDRTRLDRYRDLEPNETNRSALSSLQPDADGFAKQTVYSQTSTVTGRLIVESGPRILTLPKRYRDVIVSRYENGMIISLDYRSLEPRIVLAAQGRPAPKDIYAEVCDTIFKGALTRLQAKAITISLLYGAQEATIAKASGLSNGELQRAIESIVDYFGMNKFHERLLSEAQETGKIKNYFGRPLVLGDRWKLTNRYAQSSAVDAALLGFFHAIKFIKENELKIIPIFNIHDAMILDVHPDHVKYLDEVGRRCGQIPMFNDGFPVRCEEISSV